MSNDTFIYTPPPDDFSSPPPAGPSDPAQRGRRALGGLGRVPAALLLAGGLMIGGGIGGFVMASAASTPAPSASPSQPGTTPSTPHHCTHPGGSHSGTPASAGSASSLYSY